MKVSKELKELFKKYDLTYDEQDPKGNDIFISRNFSVITRPGIEKIQAKMNVLSDYEVVVKDDTEVVLKGKFWVKDKENEPVYSFGEASIDKYECYPLTRTKIENGVSISHQGLEKVLVKKGSVMQNPPYLFAMAEKRALSRGVLKIAGLYKYGIFGEDESDDFSTEVKRQKSQTKSNVEVTKLNG